MHVKMETKRHQSQFVSKIQPANGTITKKGNIFYHYYKVIGDLK